MPVEMKKWAREDKLAVISELYWPGGCLNFWTVLDGNYPRKKVSPGYKISGNRSDAGKSSGRDCP